MLTMDMEDQLTEISLSNIETPKIMFVTQKYFE